MENINTIIERIHANLSELGNVCLQSNIQDKQKIDTAIRSFLKREEPLYRSVKEEQLVLSIEKKDTNSKFIRLYAKYKVLDDEVQAFRNEFRSSN